MCVKQKCQNKLSQYDVEELYNATYDQGKRIIIHMGDMYLVFIKNNKLYVVDFMVQVTHGNLKELRRPLSLAIVKAEVKLTRKDQSKKVKVMRFVRTAGYPYEREMIHMFRDGNIDNITHDVKKVKDVKDFYQLMGQPVDSI